MYVCMYRKYICIVVSSLPRNSKASKLSLSSFKTRPVSAIVSYWSYIHTYIHGLTYTSIKYDGSIYVCSPPGKNNNKRDASAVLWTTLHSVMHGWWNLEPPTCIPFIMTNIISSYIHNKNAFKYIHTIAADHMLPPLQLSNARN